MNIRGPFLADKGPFFCYVPRWITSQARGITDSEAFKLSARLSRPKPIPLITKTVESPRASFSHQSAIKFHLIFNSLEGSSSLLNSSLSPLTRTQIRSVDWYISCDEDFAIRTYLSLEKGLFDYAEPPQSFFLASSQDMIERCSLAKPYLSPGLCGYLHSLNWYLGLMLTRR